MVTAPTILIVEDEPVIRMLAVDAFSSEGFTVIEAEDADEALQLFGDGGVVDLLFTDVNMPGELNGIDLAEQLKGRRPGLKVIITSALPVLRPVDHLPAAFVAKPYELNSVCSAARGLLDD